MCLQFRLTVPRSRTNLPKKKKKKKKRLTPVQQGSECFRKQVLCMWLVDAGPLEALLVEWLLDDRVWKVFGESEWTSLPAEVGEHGPSQTWRWRIPTSWCLLSLHTFIWRGCGTLGSLLPFLAWCPPCETRNLDEPPFQTPPSPGAPRRSAGLWSQELPIEGEQSSSQSQSSAAGQFPLALIFQSPGTRGWAERDNICRQRLKGSLQVTWLLNFYTSSSAVPLDIT